MGAEPNLSIRAVSMGRPVPIWGDVYDIIAWLQALPSGFSTRHREKTPLKYLIDGNSPAGAYELRANVLSCELRARETVDGSVNANHTEIAELYIAAADLYGKSGQPLEQVNNLSMAAQQYLRCADALDESGALILERTIPILDQAVTISAGQHHWRFAYRDINFLYTALCHACRHYETSEPAKTAEFASQLESIRIAARHFSRERQGGIALDAHRIEEGESGFSDDERIGNDYVSQCIAIAAQDPITLKTGLTHFDSDTIVESLDAFLNQTGNNRLKIRLVGGRFRTQDSSRENIEAVVRFLAQRNVDIISADVYGGDDGPSALVVDPHTFELEERVPGRTNGNEAISNAILFFKPTKSPLTTQFDLTCSADRSPIYLTGEALSFFRQYYIGRSEWDIEARLEGLKYEDRTLCVDAALGFAAAYRKEWHSLLETLEQNISMYAIDPTEAEVARATLLSQSFYVGENASERNSEIHALIRDGLFQRAGVQMSPFNGVLARHGQHPYPAYDRPASGQPTPN